MGLEGPGGRTPKFLAKKNGTAIDSGTSVDALALVATSTPYHQATVKAMKPGASAIHVPSANTGNVWICSGLEVLTGAFMIVPGGSMPLPDNGDLADYYLAVNTLNDGVLIVYN